jgi:hypothetical protein
MKIVAISGPMGAGKSTLAYGLVRSLNDGCETGAGATNWQVEHIASGPKGAAEGIYGVPMTTENKPIYRPLLQAMADANIALGHPERWLDRLVASHERDALLILDDVRFRYELDYLHSLRNLGVEMVHLHVYVPEVIRAERVFQRDGVRPTQAQLRHPSETDLLLDDRPEYMGVYSPDNRFCYVVLGTDGATWAAEYATKWVRCKFGLNRISIG